MVGQCCKDGQWSVRQGVPVGPRPMPLWSPEAERSAAFGAEIVSRVVSRYPFGVFGTYRYEKNASFFLVFTLVCKFRTLAFLKYSVSTLLDIGR